MNIKDYTYSDERVKMNYRVFHPDKYEKLPLLVFLHGAGERGEDLEVLYRHGVPKLISDGGELPAVVLCPQCPEGIVWDNVVFQVKEIIDSVCAEYGILSDRIVLTGLSMGGYGTWSVAFTYPDLFAGIAPVCGGGMAWRTGLLKRSNTPVRAYHGDADVTVIPEYSEIMIDRMKRDGADAELILLSGMGHNDGANYAYANTDLVDWLLSQRRADRA